MVFSYRGEIVIKTKKEEAPSLLVEDYMAKKLITFTPEQSIYDVIYTLLTHKISGGPVINLRGELVGVISEGDCMKEVVKGKYHNMPVLTGKVADHMAKNVVTIHPKMNILEVAHLFLKKRLRRFPVISDDGKLVGQISQRDIMKATLNLKSCTWEYDKKLY